jgi:hypothetical protein
MRLLVMNSVCASTLRATADGDRQDRRIVITKIGAS